VVLAAQGAQSGDARAALERLCETYWYPVYAFMRSRSGSAADAEDLTQGFFASLLEHGSIDPVRPELGRFRAFLLASAKHYSCGEWAKAQCQKRGGGQPAVPLDFVSADQRYRLEAPGQNPEEQFERQWARAAFGAACEKLRRQFAAEGKAVQFEAFQPFLMPGEEAGSYADLAAGLEMTEGAAKVAVHRARRRFAQLLRNEIADTVAAEKKSEVGEEARYLLRLMAK
jgi:RNA polymerase sigma-70 factor (ECF subfamily)